MQSTVEKLLYFLLVLVFIVSISAGYFAWQDGQEIKRQQTVDHANSLYEQKTIISNQDKLDTDLRNSVKCLFGLNPATATAEAAQACFNVVEAK